MGEMPEDADASDVRAPYIGVKRCTALVCPRAVLFAGAVGPAGAPASTSAPPDAEPDRARFLDAVPFPPLLLRGFFAALPASPASSPSTEELDRVRFRRLGMLARVAPHKIFSERILRCISQSPSYVTARVSPTLRQDREVSPFSSTLTYISEPLRVHLIRCPYALYTEKEYNQLKLLVKGLYVGIAFGF